MLCWGLIPSWTNDLKIRHQCNNAKAETMAENSSLRAAFKIRPCRVIATGFYEWQVEGCAKPPMRIGLKSQCFFPFAGLWDLG
jgi:putative SOS response-associated peptidase YedK